jgi:hypothetical protein
MWHVKGIRDTLIGFWWGNLEEEKLGKLRDRWEKGC